MSDEKDIYWCTQHKLRTRPGFLCYMYDVAPGVDAKNTPAKDMKCENCSFCQKCDATVAVKKDLKKAFDDFVAKRYKDILEEDS